MPPPLAPPLTQRPSSRRPSSAPWFADITEQVGLNFVHDAGPLGKYFMPESVGSGAALFDFDNDGRLDIYLLQNGGPHSASKNRLFHQEADGRFTDVSAGSGLDVAGYGMGVAVGDVNNDGWPDVLVTEYGRIRLFLNNGNGTFTDVTKQAGLDNPFWGTSASFVDYDRDGWLDLVVVNYVDYIEARPCAEPAGQREYCGPSSFPARVTKLYRNRCGDWVRQVRVRFRGRDREIGLGRLPGPGLGVFCADFNGDGWPDIFVANDGQANHLWINQHDGTFKDEAVARGIAFNAMGKAEANMGIAIGDVDGDGLFDLFVTHLTEETNTLWKQGPRGIFQDRTVGLGLASPRWRGTGFGTVLADFDQDGASDLALVNGRVKRPVGSPAPPPAPTKPRSSGRSYAERNQLFANDGTGKFRDISLGQPTVLRDAPRFPRFGVRGHRRRRCTRPAGDFDFRSCPTLPQRRPQSRPLAHDPRPGPGAPPGCLWCRDHRPRRRPPLGRATSIRATASCAATIRVSISAWDRSPRSRPSRSVGRTAAKKPSPAGQPTNWSYSAKAKGKGERKIDNEFSGGSQSRPVLRTAAKLIGRGRYCGHLAEETCRPSTEEETPTAEVAAHWHPVGYSSDSREPLVPSASRRIAALRRGGSSAYLAPCC